MALSRRQLLVGGGAGVGIVLAWGLWPRSYRPNLDAAPGETVYNAFLKIGADGHVAVVVPQAEMGQGVWTTLPQALADELGADWRTIAVEPAPISPLYANILLAEEAADDALPGFLHGVGGWAAREVATRGALMVTGGSTSLRGFEPRFREAGAIARALLCKAAGKRWDAAWDACDTKDGFVVHGNDRIRFGEVAAEAATLTPPHPVPLRTPGAGGLSGQSVPRIDLPSKVDGSARFAADVRLPDMAYGAVHHGPLGDTRLKRLDEVAAKAIPGVLAVVRGEDWAGIVATNTYAAQRAITAAAPLFETRGELPDSARIDKALTDALAAPGKRMVAVGDLGAALGGRPGHVADYSVPVALHAPIEPLTATARLSGDRLEVWMPTQAPGLARDAVARALGLSASAVTVYPMLVGGGFGRKIENDAAVQAALLAQAASRPVQLTWSREEETMRDRARPPARARMSATLADNGAIAGWKAQIAAPSTMTAMGERLTGRAGGTGWHEAAAVEGASPPYAIPAVGIDHHACDVGIPTGMWRGVAHSCTAFFTESFMDELARVAGVEPLGFRMAMLGAAPRLARCLTTVTALAGWDGGVAGSSSMGLAAHSAWGSHIAMVAEAHVGDGQAIVVERITAVADVGRVVHPDIVLGQIEGAIMWGLAATLGCTTGYTAGLADARNFDALGLPGLAGLPDIRVELLPSGEAPGGVGELGVPTVAPAIANALFAATGQRLRSLPLVAGGA